MLLSSAIVFFVSLEGFCPYLWCREPSGVYYWVHQRSNQKVLLHRKVNWNTLLPPPLFFYSPFMHLLSIYCIYTECLCVGVRMCVHVCRDSLLASLLDGVRASGNRDVCVKMAPTQRGQRWGLMSMPVDEEVESLHLKFLAAPPSECEILLFWCINRDEMTADIYYSRFLDMAHYNIWRSNLWSWSLHTS